MNKLEHRIAALEAQQQVQETAPNVIYLVACHRQPDGTVTGEAVSAMLTGEAAKQHGSNTITRNDGETEADFKARVEAGLPHAAPQVQLSGDIPRTEAGQLDVKAMDTELLRTVAGIGRRNPNRH
jgi:hypothetical protein